MAVPPPGLYSILCLNLNFIFLKGAKLLRGNPRPKLEGTVTGALNYQQAHTKFLPIRCYTPAQPSDVHAKLYPHRGTMGRGGEELGLMDPPLISILPSVESL